MKKTVVGWIILAAIAWVPISFAQNYVDVAGDVGLELSHELGTACPPPLGVGSAWADFDDDGDIDLFVTSRGAANHLYRNDGDTTGDGLPDFTDIAGDAGFPVDDPLGVGHAAVFIDYDNDGDQDLYVTNWDGNTLYKNLLVPTGTAQFVDVTSTAGIADSGRAISAAWGDYDGDSFLDVYVAKHYRCGGDDLTLQDHLFKNMGNGTFTDVTGELCPGGVDPCDAVLNLGFAPTFIDYDNDNDLDLYVVNDDIQGNYSPNNLFRNDGSDGMGGWVWTDVSIASGANISLNGMGLGVGDYDNDGFFDFAFSNIGKNQLLRNLGDGTFTNEGPLAGIERDTLPGGEVSVTWGTTFLDYNNDGLLDLLYIAGYLGDGADTFFQPNAFFENNGDMTFTDVSAASGLDHDGRGRNGSVVDFDQDGWVDVFIGNYGQAPILMHNQGASLGIANNYLTVTAESAISNADAIGTRMWVTTDDGVTQMRRIASGSTHGSGDYKAAYFGLGSHTEGDLRVRWPRGAEQNLGPVAANQTLHLIEPIDAPLKNRQLVWGSFLGGSMKTLRASDDQYTRLASQDIGGFQNTMLQMTINARRNTITRMDLQVEMGVEGADDIDMVFYGWDYDAESWVALRNQPLPQGSDKVELVLDIADPNRFVDDATKNIMIRVRSRGVDAHTTSIDYVQVLTYVE